MSTLQVTSIKSHSSGAPVFQNTSGTEKGQLVKAWVLFNGTNGNIHDSFNVSSITRHSLGQYTVNFTNSFSNTNYCAIPACIFSSVGNDISVLMGNSGDRATGSCRFYTGQGTAQFDSTIGVVFIGDN